MNKNNFVSAVAASKSKKRKAQSAATESRPMPSETVNDSSMVARNDAKKPLVQAGWTDNPTVEQAQRPSKMPLKHPKIMKGGTFSTKLRDQEDDLQATAKPGTPDAQPKAMYMADGGEISQDPNVIRGAKKKIQEIGTMIKDMKPQPKADGGEVEDDMEAMPEEDSMSIEFQRPMDDEDMDQSKSISDAIMAKRRKMASGGEILSEDSIYSDDSDQADLSRNAQEDANMEDRLSFDALRKELYDESEGLSQLDSPVDSNRHAVDLDGDELDMISAIRRKLKNR